MNSRYSKVKIVEKNAQQSKKINSEDMEARMGKEFMCQGGTEARNEDVIIVEELMPQEILMDGMNKLGPRPQWKADQLGPKHNKH